MFTTSQQPKFEHSEGSILLDLFFPIALGEVFGEAIEQGYEVVDTICDIREDRTNGLNRGSQNNRAFAL